MGGDIILVGEESISLRTFRDLINQSSVKRNSSDISDFKIQDSEMALSDLETLESVPVLQGGRGMGCMGNQRWGIHGKNVIIKCPIDVDIRDVKSGKIVANISRHGQEELIARGGVGGKGLTGKGLDRRRWNSLEEKQRAREWVRGQPGDDIRCSLELKRIADVALIGYPNAGKERGLYTGRGGYHTWKVVTYNTRKVVTYNILGSPKKLPITFGKWLPITP